MEFNNKRIVFIIITFASLLWEQKVPYSNIVCVSTNLAYNIRIIFIIITFASLLWEQKVPYSNTVCVSTNLAYLRDISCGHSAIRGLFKYVHNILFF
jgi:uncharacterized oligopeptide transporter (OPT) family protein